MGPPPCAKYWPRREASCYEKRQTHTPTPLIVIKTPSLTLTHETQKLLSNFSPRPYIGLKKLLLLLKAGFKSNPGPVRKMEKRGAVYHQKNFHKYWSWRRCLQNQDTIILACQITKACHQHNSPIKVRLSCFKKWLKSHLVTGWSVNYVQLLQI